MLSPWLAWAVKARPPSAAPALGAEQPWSEAPARQPTHARLEAGLEAGLEASRGAAGRHGGPGRGLWLTGLAWVSAPLTGFGGLAGLANLCNGKDSVHQGRHWVQTQERHWC